jgi:hypothetical protein
MVSFAEAISLNLAMDQDPDFIITISGMDVKDYIQEWDITDAEQGMSQLQARLANPDMILSGKFKYQDPLEIRFGYNGNLSPKAELPISEVREHYPTQGGCTITVTARDESQKMHGNKGRGKDQGDDLEAFDKNVKDTTSKTLDRKQVEGSQKEDPKEGQTRARMNETDKEYKHKIAKRMKTKEGKGGGSQPSNPLSQDKGKKAGHTFSSAKRGSAANRASNHSKNHKNSPINASLTLKGFPTLRAKTTVQVLNVGPEATGTYYVSSVTHSWKPRQGYKTVAQLQRGGSGKGGAGGDPAMVFYSDIWKEGNFYLGPRKMDENPQCTFTYGEGKNLVDFEYCCKPQQERHGGEEGGSEGAGIDLDKKGESYVEKTLDQKQKEGEKK